MQVTTIGLDLAKNVFQVHGVSEDGGVTFNRALRMAQVLSFFESLEPCLVGIDACGTSHHWAREIRKLGHNVKLISPVYVKPYVKRGKSEAVDAEAICEAVGQAEVIGECWNSVKSNKCVSECLLVRESLGYPRCLTRRRAIVPHSRL